jgi:hypothetical protein
LQVYVASGEQPMSDLAQRRLQLVGGEVGKQNVVVRGRAAVEREQALAVAELELHRRRKAPNDV